MPSNLAIDDRLLNQALKLGGHKTKRETVNQALHEFIQRRKQAGIKEFFGKVDFAPLYDYKAGRKRA